MLEIWDTNQDVHLSRFFHFQKTENISVNVGSRSMMMDIITVMIRTVQAAILSLMTMIRNTRSMAMEANLKANLNPNLIKVNLRRAVAVEVVPSLEELTWVHRSVEAM